MKPELSQNNLESLANELRVIFRHLSPEDNVNGFLWTGTIEAGVETSIPNKMKDRTNPKYFVVLMIEGVSDLVKGSNWSDSFVTLKNVHPTDSLTATVYFFR